MRSIGGVPIAAVALAMLLPLACAGEPGDGSEMAPGDASIQAKLDQFAPVTLGFDETLLDVDQRRVVKELVEASRRLDDIFRLQAWRGNVNAFSLLPSGDDPESAATRAYYDIMYGPWDRLTGEEPFIAGAGHKPHGAGFYPEDMTREEFEGWIAAHPEDETAFKSETTLIERTEDGGLKAVPYHEAYSALLEAASDNLLAAAERANNPSLKRFLELRAGALLSDDFYDSEVAWMQLSDNLIEPTLGPYENYEDQLFGYKISYESFIGLKDPVESERLASLVEHLPALEAALPIPDRHKYLDRSFQSPISVVTLIYAAGETRAGIQTIAFNLPNDPRVREGEGSKKVMLRNVIDAKFETNLKPIAEQVLVPEQSAKISVDPYFTRVLMHELAHGLGPDYVTGQPDLTARQALKDRYAALEEAKADAVGTNSLRILTGKGVYDEAFLEEVYIDHVADMFRCVRFGITEAHGLGCLIQFNFLRARGAITYDEATGLFAADLDIIPVAIAEMAHVFLMMQATGDYDGAGIFSEKYGSISPEMQGALDRLSQTVPVDILPHYAVEDMMADW
jgi:hypothetical protein